MWYSDHSGRFMWRMSHVISQKWCISVFIETKSPKLTTSFWLADTWRFDHKTSDEARDDEVASKAIYMFHHATWLTDHTSMLADHVLWFGPSCQDCILMINILDLSYSYQTIVINIFRISIQHTDAEHTCRFVFLSMAGYHGLVHRMPLANCL